MFHWRCEVAKKRKPGPFGLADLKSVLSQRGMLPYEGGHCFTDKELVRLSEPYQKFSPAEALAVHDHYMACNAGCVAKLDKALDVADVEYDFDHMAGFVDERLVEYPAKETEA